MPQVLIVSSQQGSTPIYTARRWQGKRSPCRAWPIGMSWRHLSESRALRALGHGQAAIPGSEEDNMDRTFYLVQVSCCVKHGITPLCTTCSHVWGHSELEPYSNRRMQPETRLTLAVLVQHKNPWPGTSVRSPVHVTVVVCIVSMTLMVYKAAFVSRPLASASYASLQQLLLLQLTVWVRCEWMVMLEW